MWGVTTFPMDNEFGVTASLKGAIGETLLTEHQTAIREFFSAWCLDDLEANDPELLPNGKFRTTFSIERAPHSYDVYVDGDYATWYPDALYSLRFEPATRRHAAFDPYDVEFPIEVKTGTSSELSDNQRAVMATLEQQDTTIVPLRVRVDTTDLPDSFSVRPHRISHSGDRALPEYSAEDPERSAGSTDRAAESTTLSSFAVEAPDDLE